MASSPTQRTLQRLRADGYIAAVVEKWNAHAGVRNDLFGFIDVLSINPVSGEVRAIQTTSSGNVSARRKKILGPDLREELAAVRRAGWVVEVWGWKKDGRYWGCVVDRLIGNDWTRMQ